MRSHHELVGSNGTSWLTKWLKIDRSAGLLLAFCIDPRPDRTSRGGQPQAGQESPIERPNRGRTTVFHCQWAVSPDASGNRRQYLFATHMMRDDQVPALARCSAAARLFAVALLGAGVALLLAPAANLAAAELPDSAVVATVADRPITAGAIRLGYELGEGLDRSRPDADLKRNILDLLINREVLVIEAEQRRLHRTGALSRFMRGLETKLATDELRERIYGGKINITEEQIQELYERYYYTYRCSHLSVDQPERADDIHRRLLAGEDFGDLARRYSEDAKSAKNGGDLGDQGAGTLIIEFEDAVFGLQPGELTPVIKGKGEHYKIFRLETMVRDREPDLSLEEMWDYLKRRVKTRQSGGARYAWELNLLDEYEFVMLEDNYTRFADHLRDNIAIWEAIYSVRPDSLTHGWIFSNWDTELRDLELTRMRGARLTVAEFLKQARDLPGCPTCLWRDNDVMLRQQVKGMSFDKMFDLEIRDIRAEDLPWIKLEMTRRRDDRLVDMITALMAVKPEAISDEEVRVYHDAQTEQPRVGPKAKVQRIVVESEDQAWDIWERLQGGADFRALAERFSIDKRTNYLGGETDFFGAGTMEGMANVALQHEKGDLVSPFESSKGWEIILVLDIQPERDATFEETKESARRILARARTRAAVVELTTTRRAATSVQIDTEALEQASLVASF